MPLGPRLGLIVVLLLGTFACVSSGIRISYLTTIEEQADFTYVGGLPLLWSIIEPCMGISCACLSTLRPFYRVLHHSIQRLRASAPKLLATRRPIFHSATQKVSISGIGKFTKNWGGHSQKEPPGIDDVAVAVKGSSRIEMRSMGYSTLDSD